MPIPSVLLDQKEREIQQALVNLLALPSLTRSEVGHEDSCPICLLPLDSVCEEYEAAEGKEEGPSDISLDGASPRQVSMMGVVKLASCGHIFCRKDLAEWIESHHGSCPACRRIFFEFTSIDEADYESSDGGEYIPEEDEDNDWYTDDGDFDVVTSSEVDYDMDDDTPEEEESGDEAGYFPLARMPSDTDFEADGTNPLRPWSLYTPNADDDLRVYSAAEVENEAPEDGNVEAPGELSYGSESPSSEEASFKTEDFPDANDVDIGAVSDKLGTDESNVELSKDVERTKAKSSTASGHCPSETRHDNVL